MRWYLLALIVLLGIVGHCRSQEENSAGHTAQKTNSLSSVEAPVAGTWRWDIPAKEEANTFVEIRLSDDHSWTWSVHSDNPRTDPDEQAGTWFVHERTLVLRIAKTKLRLV